MQKRWIQSIISKYLQAIERIDVINRFGLNVFVVQTLDPKRTFCDKISRLTRLSYDDNYEMLIAKHIRDVYDIHCLMNVSEYLYFIQSEEFMYAMSRVIHEDGLYRNSQSHKPIAKTRIFAESEQTLKLPEVFRAYSSELRQLMFEAKALPKLDEVIINLSLLQKLLCQFDSCRYRNA
jgi:hypothetical protein